MASNKTVATEASVENYFAAITDAARRKDCEALSQLMSKATKLPAKMWGAGIVGFGSYHYKYDSGREGDMCLVGFSSRKAAISIYGLTAGPNRESLIAKLGKHKLEGSCIHVKSLADLDLKILETMTREAATATAKAHAL